VAAGCRHDSRQDGGATQRGRPFRTPSKLTPSKLLKELVPTTRLELVTYRV
jgi:hypothetical protein